MKILSYLWSSNSDNNFENLLLKENAETKTFTKVNVINLCPEAYLKHWQISNMESFMKIVNG